MSVHTVAEVTRLLYSDKITERKKASERFRSLLDDKTVVAALDRCTDEKSNFTWNSALQAVLNHIQKEFDQRAKDKTKGAGTPGARAMNLTISSSLLKLVIKKANLRKARLHHLPLDHILSVLQDEDLVPSLGTEYCNILLKEILEKRHVWSTIPLYTWQDLLKTVCELYSRSIQTIDKNVLMKTLERIITIGSVQTQLNFDELFRFFTEVAKSIRQEVTSNQDDCLSALISFSRAVAPQFRIKLCQHGEEILHFILNLWELRANQHKKELIIEYLRIQMVTHHPNGSITPESGAYVCDQNSWKVTLQKIYNCLHNELKEMVSKGRYSQSKQQQSLNLLPSFLKLFAEVCRQVNSYAYEDLHAVMVAEPGSAYKKRKTQTAFSTLLDAIHEQAESLNVVCWLKLLIVWLTNFPDTLKSSELTDLVLQLHQLMLNCKKSEIMDALLNTCLACVDCYTYLNNSCKPNTSIAVAKQSHWALIYSKVKLTLNLSITRESSLKLLTALVNSKLIKPELELWQLFGDSSKIYSDLLLQLLSACMEQSPLPEHESLQCAASFGQTSSNTTKNMHNEFRCQILNWLLPCILNEEQQLLIIPYKTPINSFVNILCLLLFRNVSQNLMKTKDCTLTTQESLQTDRQLANFYLSSSFFMKSSKVEPCEESPKNDNLSQDSRVLPDVKQKLVELLIRDACHLLEFANAEDHVKLLGSHCCLLVKVVQQLITLDVISVEEANDHRLTQHIRALFKKLITFMEVSRKNPSYHTTYLQVLNVLSPLVVNNNATEAAFMRSIMAQKLIDILTEVLHHAVTSSKNRLAEPMESDDDLFDPSAEFQTDDDFEVNSVNPAHFAQQIRNSDELINPAMLNDAELLAVKVGEFLSLWCCMDLYSIRRLNSETDTRVLKKHLLECVKDAGFEFQTPFNLQLALKILTNLIRKDQQHDEETLYASIFIMKTLFATFHKDAFITATSLDLLQTMMYHVGRSSVKNQEITIHQLKAFWKLHTKKKLGIHLLIAFIQCVAALAEVDKGNVWGRWDVPPDDPGLNSGTDTPVALSLIKFLNHGSYEVQMSAACNLPLLVNYAEPEQLLPQGIVQWKKKVLLLIFKACLAAEPENVNLTSDQARNYTSVLLRTVIGIANACPYCENAAICFLFEVSTKKTVDLSIVNKVFGQILSDVGYLSREEFLAAQVKFILNYWFEMKWALDSFPYQLLDCSTQSEFYRKHASVLVVLSLLHIGMNGVDELATILEEESVTLITRCIPQIIAEIMPFVVGSKLNSDFPTLKSDGAATAKAKTAFTALESLFPAKVLQKIMTSELTSITVQLMLFIEETEDGNNGIGRVMPPTISYVHSSEIVFATCRDLVQQINTGKNISIISALTTVEDGLQIVLLELKGRLLQARGFYKKWRFLLIYVSFVRQLLVEVTTDLTGNRRFVIQDVIHTLVHFLNENSQKSQTLSLRCAQQACDLLQEICVAAVKTCPNELGEHLQVIVGTLVALKLPDLKVKATKLLKILLVSNADTLESYIRCLDPLPDVMEMAEVLDTYHKVKYGAGNLTLIKEIEYFLNATDSITVTFPRSVGLRYLKKQLATRKEELKQMFTEIESECVFQGSEDCSSSLLHCLVVELIHLSRSHCCEESIEAGRCLGEIGPADLSSLVLEIGPASKHKQLLDVFADDSLAQRNVIIFKRLLEYLFSDDIGLVNTTSCVLKEILCTQSGQQFVLLYKSKHVDNMVEILHPFISKSQRRKTNLSPSEDIALLQDPNLWTSEAKDHQTWITDLVSILIMYTTDEVLGHLVEISKMKYDFCEQILPFLIHALLSSGSQDMQGLLSGNISSFFEKHCASQDASVSSQSSSQTSGTVVDAPVYNNHQSIKSMLCVIQYLRTQDRNIPRCQILAWENNFWLAVNYFHVARAAIYCRAYFTSLMALEIWFDDVERMSPSHRQSLESVLYESDDIYTSTYQAMPALQEKCEGETMYGLILESYRSIGEQDGWYGCGAAPLTKPSIRVMQYEQENQWQKALATYDSEAVHKPLSVRNGLPNTLKMLGLSHLLQHYLQHGSSDNVRQGNLEELRELEYECAWRLGQWSPAKPSSAGVRFHESIYNCLVSIREGDYPSCVKYLKEGQKSVIQELSGESLESTYSVYPFLERMQMLTVIEEYKDAVDSKNFSIEALMIKWKEQDLIPQVNFLFSEPVVSLQCTLLQQNSTSLLQMKSLVDRLTLKIEFARKSGYLQIAAATVNNMKELKHLIAPQSWYCQLQEARTFWQDGESQVAIYLMSKLLKELKMVYQESSPNAAAAVYSNALGVYSNWLIEARSESPNVILNCLTIAIEVCSDNSTDLMDASLAAGRFADSHYQRIQNYKKSEMFEAKQELIEKSRREAHMLFKQVQQDPNPDKNRAANLLHKQSKIDEQEVEALKRDQQTFLEEALVSYLRCLQAGDACNLRVFRLMTLWFQNQHDENVDKSLQKALNVKTHKFLPVMYQCAARMSTDHTPFQETLTKLIEQVSSDHPHHTLHIILALCNATADDRVVHQKTSRRSKLQEVPQEADEERIAAAKDVWTRLLDKPKLRELMEKMEKLCAAYINLSNFFVDPKKIPSNVSIPIANREPLLKLEDMSIVPDVTLNIPVDPSANYSNIPGIARIEPHFQLCGGVNAPKRLVCVGTDGVRRTQLLKGKDDLRQDAVMQQVFGIVNSMLKQNAETKKRNLQIRTYKVVPLSQRSGILQWCVGTLPIGDYLLGDQMKKGAPPGAHGRYYPKDWTGTACRKKLFDAAGSPPGQKLKVFHEISRNLHPVFRHFFLENFTEPPVWFESRLKYTKSVATTSMVGYILGLGDRHVQNILIDQKTAELVHIDLGVAFEQGKVLPTPETVPFRLTRDIVDGMGITGVEGVFRRCCEKTLDVLRLSQEVVTTILDVLLYDPLYVWSISPMKACTLQPEPIETQLSSTARSTVDREMRPPSVVPAEMQRNGKDGEPNKHAERCLLRVQHKLQGMEEGVTMSVMGQVNHLIQEATDPKNLCRLYSGWQPYL